IWTKRRLSGHTTPSPSWLCGGAKKLVLSSWQPAQVCVVARSRMLFTVRLGSVRLAAIWLRKLASVKVAYSTSVAPRDTLSNPLTGSALVIVIVAAFGRDSEPIWLRNAAWNAGALALVPVNSSLAGLTLSVTCSTVSAHDAVDAHGLVSWN